MSRKAVIYIRTSSESQGEKSSPNEQEADCQHLAVEKGLTLVRVYRDVEKYQAKNEFLTNVTNSQSPSFDVNKNSPALRARGVRYDCLRE